MFFPPLPAIGALLIRSTASLFVLAALCLLATGCQQSVSTRLVGAWQGRPDTTAAAAKRSAELKAKERKLAGDDAVAAPTDAESDETPAKTDLELHDLAIELTFAENSEVSMSLGDGSQPLNGTWRVVEILPPRGAEIEISLAEIKTEATDKPAPPSEKRRFIVDFQGDDPASGYTLVEKGADPQFGRLYFEKK